MTYSRYVNEYLDFYKARVYQSSFSNDEKFGIAKIANSKINQPSNILRESLKRSIKIGNTKLPKWIYISTEKYEYDQNGENSGGNIESTEIATLENSSLRVLE